MWDEEKQGRMPRVSVRVAILLLMVCSFAMIAAVWRLGSKPAPKAKAPPPRSPRGFANPQYAPPQASPAPVVTRGQTPDDADANDTVKRLTVVRKDGETLVEDGETVVTEGYESEPGIFVFTTLTPTRRVSQEGKPVVNVVGNSFQVGLDGGYAEIASFDHDLQPRGVYTRAKIDDEMVYSVNVSADADAGSSKIRMKASGSAARRLDRPADAAGTSVPEVSAQGVQP